MNLIAKLLPPANVVVGLEASSKKRAFEQAGLLFENNHGIARSTVFDSLSDKLDRQVLKYKDKASDHGHDSLKQHLAES